MFWLEWILLGEKIQILEEKNEKNKRYYTML